MLKPIAIVGAGGLGKEILVLLHQINEVTPVWDIKGFYDDNTELQGQLINGFPCLGTINDLSCTTSELYVTVALGSPHIKAQLVNRLQNPKLHFPVLVHPTAALKPYQHISIAEGTVVLQGAVLTTNIKTGKHVLIYLNCTVGHDAVIGNFSSLMPGTNLGGNTILEDQVFMGANATVLQGITIGTGAIVGAGSVVTKNLPNRCTAVGVPAKIIKHDQL
ncbi:acetyltransferase [Pontibacter silvestris]|uniref:Acetyltransferase n=1 Tax=Pontibacter silvestris TaxID=2305183 RepID=A0ABW4WUC2_9BACT|nr:acetyltransferase [Pontibacter silvestris]MCC9136199.1 acetyltransferase [Pontibacter silvestris]